MKEIHHDFIKHHKVTTSKELTSVAILTNNERQEKASYNIPLVFYRKRQALSENIYVD